MIPCYGLEKISNIPTVDHVTYSKLSSKLRQDPKQMERPTSINILISTRQNRLHLAQIKMVNEIIFFKVLLGHNFGSHNPDINVSSQESKSYGKQFPTNYAKM